MPYSYSNPFVFKGAALGSRFPQAEEDRRIASRKHDLNGKQR